MAPKSSQAARRAKGIAKAATTTTAGSRTTSGRAVGSAPERVEAFVGRSFVFCIRIGWLKLDHLTGIGSVLLATLTYHAMLLTFRTQTMSNVANRRVWFTALVATWGILLHRIFGWWLGMDVEHVLSQDILILAVATGNAGVSIRRGVLLITGVLVLLAGVSAACPWLALELWTAALSITFFLLAVLFARWVRSEPAT